MKLYTEITEEQKAFCQANGYYWPHLIRGRICAIHRFFTTTGVLFGIDPDPRGVMCERRYCFAEPSDAMQALDYWAEHPNMLHATGLWKKVKGVIRRDPNDNGARNEMGLDNRPADLWLAMRNMAAVTSDMDVMVRMDRIVPVPGNLDAMWEQHDQPDFEFPHYEAPLSNEMGACPLLYRGY